MAIGKKMLQTYHFEHAKTIKKQNQQLNTIEYIQSNIMKPYIIIKTMQVIY